MIPSIDRDALMAYVLTEHGMVISKDDPIFTILMVHEFALKQYQGMLNQQFFELHSGMERTGKEEFLRTKALGEQLATKTVNAVELTGNRQVEKLDKVFKNHLEELKVTLDQQHQSLKWVAWTCIACSVISV